MSLQFTTQRRRSVRRRRINHRTPTTIREKMIAGLQALGFEKVQTRASKYDVFSHGQQNWYVGANGALRIGETVATAHAAGVTTKDLVITAPVVRPIVRSWLDTNQQNIVPADGVDFLVQKMLQENPVLTEVNSRVVSSHVKTWLKEQGYEVND
jgi:hypothetical protein